MPEEGGTVISTEAGAADNRELLIKTRELIEHTRREVSRLHDEIQSARETIDQAQRLLARIEVFESG